MKLRLIIALLFAFVSAAQAIAADPVEQVMIRAQRDLGYFAGDLVKASIDIDVAEGFELETPSLPRSGPINYWLDLRTIDVTRHAAGNGLQRYTLAITYQDFYDALDARQQEIPTFPVLFKSGTQTATANVPAWTIGVSPLREVAPPPKEDPKDYMRADAAVPSVKVDGLWEAAAAFAAAALLACLLLAYDKGVWPFQARPARAFGTVARRLRKLSAQTDTDERYIASLLLIHRGIDHSDGRRILSDDLGGFLARHPIFAPAGDGLGHFFVASRDAFFASNTARSRATMPYKALQRLAERLATAERTAP